MSRKGMYRRAFFNKDPTFSSVLGIMNKEDKMAKRVLYCARGFIECCGYELYADLEIRDKKTGVIYVLREEAKNEPARTKKAENKGKGSNA